MKPNLLRLLVVVATVLGLGCNRDVPFETLLIAGSGSMHGDMQPVVEAFGKKHPRLRIVNEEGGATAAVVALKRGSIQIATLGRDLATEEDDLSIRGYMVARNAVAIVVHPSNPVNDLKLQEINAIYSGEQTSWKTFGGPDKPITFIIRDKVDTKKQRPSSSRQTFDDLVMSGDDPALESRVLGSAAEVLDAVKQDPTAIGYVALRDLTPEVKALSVSGVPINRFTILSTRYPISRSYFLAVVRPSALVEEFVSFAISKEGQEIFHTEGLIPVY